MLFRDKVTFLSIYNALNRKKQYSFQKPLHFPSSYGYGLICGVESLHTFAHIINRTRRRDIGNFTLRKPETLKVSFTSEQQERFDRKDGDLYNELYFDDSLY